MAIFGDDPTTDYIDGPQNGESLIWLIQSGDNVFEANINWVDDALFTPCSTYPGANGFCQGEISIGPYFWMILLFKILL